LRIKNNDGAELYIREFAERKTAEKTGARFVQLNEKGEIFEVYSTVPEVINP
jgi:hypothetical protein